MEKNHVFDQIPDYLDGNLNKSAEKAFENHIAQCAECKKEMEEMKTFFNVFEEAVPTPSDRLKSKFESALEQEKLNQGKVVQLESKSSSNWTGNILKN